MKNDETAEGARWEALDGNEAAARVAYALSEVIAIYPITPASPMGEESDLWASLGRANLWGAVPRVVEMQSEAGAIGTIHGALSAGALATTFTSSQGLLLMIPALYKIAGELNPFVLHVAARAVATHALSIFGDHSDVMSVRGTGFAMLCSASVQEAHDFAAIAHAATLESRVPFLHFFDGFRTSHEIQNVALLEDEDLRALLPEGRIAEARGRALSPDHPTLRGTAQNPDVFFQGREAANAYYDRCPALVQAAMDRFAVRTGRAYKLFEYEGHPEAERVIVMMGSGAETVGEAVGALNARGEKVGLVKVRLYRPFCLDSFTAALPVSVRSAAVLDRTKEPGSVGEPLFLDVAAALAEKGRSVGRLIGGRYGLGSKEFTPAMAAAVFDELKKDRPKRRFTIGIKDDVGGTSLDWDPSFSTESAETFRAVFYGLGSDGTVGANKAAIKLIAEQTGLHAQGYFVYDSKKSGASTVSHLRFGPHVIRAPYLIGRARFVACHQESLLSRFDVLEAAEPEAVFLLNCARPENAWERLPRSAQEAVLAKKLKFYAIDARRIAKDSGLSGRINTVMQACFFAISEVVPDAVELLKASVRKTYARKGAAVVAANEKALESAVAGLRRITPPTHLNGSASAPGLDASAPAFVRDVTAPILAGRGDDLPVSALPVDGTWPVSTARYEKRGLAAEIPVWEQSLCIQCNKCALVCPHAAIRVKAYEGAALSGAPSSFKSMPWRGRDYPEGTRYTVQVAPEDCTGCRLCVEVCPGKDKADPARRSLAMAGAEPLLGPERPNFEFFLNLKQAAAAKAPPVNVKYSQMSRPLFEFSGACAGCGETPYLKLLTQLFGDRLAVANATGCSSIFGGNLPTTPWCAGDDGRGPAWSNSLFENNAEFGLGFRLAYDKQADLARGLLKEHAAELGPAMVEGLLDGSANGEDLPLQRARVAELKVQLKGIAAAWAKDLAAVCESLVKRSVWIVGGDGWAYDIGSGGVDHVLRSGADVKLLILDTEVYSNTGGQASKATPRAAVAKFAHGGKSLARKDLAVESVVMGGAYVARVALGADDAQALRAFTEAEAYPGPALIVAYSPCIAHGIEMSGGLKQQQLAVASGHWPLFRFDPCRAGGRPPLEIDSKAPSMPLRDYALREGRYKELVASRPEEAERLMAQAQRDVDKRWKLLQSLARDLNEAG